MSPAREHLEQLPEMHDRVRFPVLPINFMLLRIWGVVWVLQSQLAVPDWEAPGDLGGGAWEGVVQGGKGSLPDTMP